MDTALSPALAAEQSETGERAKQRQIYRTAVEFEALLVQEMLKTMRAATEAMSKPKDDTGLSLYQDMADAEMARAIASGQRGGLAAQLYRQLTGSSPDPALVARHSRGRWSGSVPAAGSPPRSSAAAPSRAELERWVAQAAQAHRLPVGLAEAVVTRESDWDTTAVSPKGALGLMQLMPETARDLGLSDPRDPRQNIAGGVSYLAGLLDRFDGDVPLALAAYNAGPGAVLAHQGIPPFEETRTYVASVLESWSYNERLNSDAKATMLKERVHP